MASPYLPFWTEWQSWPHEMPLSNVIFTRPYTFSALLAYLQLQTPIARHDITRGYYEGDMTPREVVVAQLGFDGFADAYADFNAKLTAMIIEGTQGRTLTDFIFTDAQRAVAASGLWDNAAEFQSQSSHAVVRPIAAMLDVSVANGSWTEPAAVARPFGWGYNVVALEGADWAVTLNFVGDEMRLRLVTLANNSWTILTVTDGDTLDLVGVQSAYLVITSTPQRMSGYQRYSYRLRLQWLSHLTVWL